MQVLRRAFQGPFAHPGRDVKGISITRNEVGREWMPEERLELALDARLALVTAAQLVFYLMPCHLRHPHDLLVRVVVGNVHATKSGQGAASLGIADPNLVGDQHDRQIEQADHVRARGRDQVHRDKLNVGLTAHRATAFARPESRGYLGVLPQPTTSPPAFPVPCAAISASSMAFTVAMVSSAKHEAQSG